LSDVEIVRLKPNAKEFLRGRGLKYIMRTLDDLIDETMAEKKLYDLFTLSIVVGFGKETKFVQARDERKPMLIELSELVEAGGEPLGLVGTVHSEGKRSVTIYHKIFQEYADDGFIQKFFGELMSSMENAARAQGMRVGPKPEPEKN
jgi:hypothetical protein